MLSTLIGLLVGYALLGSVVTNLVSQLMQQAQTSLGAPAVAAGEEEEAPMEEGEGEGEEEYAEGEEDYYY